jgi:uncharacterized protein (TIGR02099 family)
MTGLPGWMRTTLRLLAAGMALSIILLALVVSLGRQLLPLVAEYRSELEQKITDVFGMPAHIGALEGHWDGFAPSIALKDVQLGEGENPLHFDGLQLRPNLLGSLLAGEIRLASLMLDGLRVSTAETEDGRWRVQGLRPQEDKPFDAGPVLRALERIGMIAVSNAQLTIQPRNDATVSLNYIDLSLQSEGNAKRLDGRVLTPDGEPITFSARGRLVADNLKQSNIKLYASVPQSDWAKWIPQSFLHDYRLSHLQGGGEVWADWDAGALARAVARLNMPQVLGSYADRALVEVRDLAVSAYLDRKDGVYQLRLASLAATLNEKRWGETDLLITRSPAQAGNSTAWSVAASRVELGPLTPIILALGPLPVKAAEALEALSPSGAVENLNVRYTPSARPESQVQLSANLDRVGFGDFRGAPAVENASGSIEGGLDKGELKVNSEDFVLHLAQLFPKPWRYDHAAGRLTWTFNDDAFTLVGHYLRADGPVGKAAGDFLIRLKRDPTLESYMDLRVGLRDGDARYTADYIPTRTTGLSPELSEWLTTAIHSGHVDEGYFQYQGSLKKASAATARRLTLYAKARDAELQYQRGWPLLAGATGEVFVEDAHVRVRAPAGQLLDSTVHDVNVDIAKATDDVVHLKLQGRVDGTVSDALKTLSEAPIEPARLFAQWRGKGPLQGTLSLDIPFRKGRTPKILVDFETRDATFAMSSPKLDFSKVTGRFRFDSSRGLSASEVTAEAFGQPVRGRAFAEGAEGALQTRVEATGSMPWERLAAWLSIEQPLPVSGRIPYLLDLRIGETGNLLKVESTLEGLTVDLPPPFGKVSGEARPASFRMTLGDTDQRFWADYDDLANLSLLLPSGELSPARGELRLGGGQAGMPSAQGLSVSGSIEQFDLAQWQSIGQRYLAADAASSPRGRAPHSNLLRKVDLHFDQFRAMGQVAANLNLVLQRQAAGWELELASQMVTGKASIPDSDTTPIAIRLAKLQLPALETPGPSDEPSAENADPLASFDPRTLPPLDVRIDRLLLGDDVLGGWSFTAQPTAKGARFDKVDLDLKKGMKLTGSLSWEGPVGAARSQYQGRLEGKNLSEVLLAWGFAPTATSEDFRLDVNGNWPGSPAAVRLRSFSGEMDARLRKGAFVEVEGRASALRVFGLLNFNAIGRRLRLDFSDLLGRGLAYDEVKGTLVADRGIYITRKPITMEGPSSDIEINGTLDMVAERINADMQVALPLTNNLPIAALIVGAPAIGGALFVVDRLLGDRVARFASVHYKIEGPMRDPEMSFERP